MSNRLMPPESRTCRESGRISSIHAWPGARDGQSVLPVNPDSDTYHDSFDWSENPKKKLEVLPAGLFITTVLVMLN